MTRTMQREVDAHIKTQISAGPMKQCEKRKMKSNITRCLERVCHTLKEISLLELKQDPRLIPLEISENVQERGKQILDLCPDPDLHQTSSSLIHPTSFKFCDYKT